MKTIPLKTFVIPVEGIDTPFNYGSILRTAINTSAHGMDIEEIRVRVKLLERLNNKKLLSKKEFEIQDDEIDIIKAAINRPVWTIADKGFLEFFDLINAL